MRLHYPGSFFKLLLLGFVLAAIPLALALVDAYLSIERLTRQSEQTIASAMQITHDSRTLGEQMTTLERIARQQLILGNVNGLDNYADARRQFRDAYASLALHINDQPIRNQLTSLKDHDEAVWQLLQQTPYTHRTSRQVLAQFDAMSQTSADLRQAVDTHIAAEVLRVKHQAAQERRAILKKLWLLVPVGLLLITVAALVIRMPIRQLGAAIRGLGEGQLDQPISVHGPHDMETLGRQLDWLRSRLQAADAQQTRFLHQVSHELKTPLTALYEGSQLLHDSVVGPLNAGQTEVVGIMQSNVARMRQLIEELLDYGRLRFQPPVLHREIIALADLFAAVEQDQRLALSARGLQLQAQDNGLSISADREMLTMVLNNLLSNAIKFAPEQTVIQLTGRRSAGQITIEVSDQGPGIPAGQVEKMFEPFVQGAGALNAAVKGSGLGLAIVRELIGAHGGEITLQTNQPHGLRAVIRLPLRSLT